jgi:hypothetical protein
MNEQTSDRQNLLRRALRGNALFSILSGVVILVTNRTLAEFLGLPGDADLTAVGIGLLAYAGWLLWNARRKTIRVVEAWIAVILDILWVIGSYALVFAATLSSGGKWIVGMVAEMVLLFGVVQWLGLRRIGRSRQPV